MTPIIESIHAEYLRYKALADAALAQLTDTELVTPGPGSGNSIATICWHVSGNLRSRFTDFLGSDGEKPWRTREEEFLPRTVSRDELVAKWDQGWQVLLATLAELTDEQLPVTVTMRKQPLRVHEALLRSLAHVSYHVGQIVYAAKALRGPDWTYLSIPPGQTDAYNRAPKSERPADHQAAIAARVAKP